MTNRHRRMLSMAGIAFVLLLTAPSADAQQRPTLGRIEAVMCAQAEEDGDTYRPIFCDGRCDCLDSVDVATVASCVQQPSSDVQIDGATPPHDSLCMAICTLISTSKLGLCASDAECSGGSCLISLTGNCVDPSSIGQGCSDDSDCDQSKGYTCITAPGSPPFTYCRLSSCSVEGVCDSGVVTPTYEETFEFAPVGDVTPLACGPTGTNVNSSDIAVCIDEVEAVLGAGACVICGDGNLDPGEGCDDGNLTPGDGCDASCQVES